MSLSIVERTQLSSGVDCTFLDHTFCMADVSLICENHPSAECWKGVCAREGKV